MNAHHQFTIPHAPYEPLWPAWQERHQSHADEIDARENEAAIAREAERARGHHLDQHLKQMKGVAR
jgi:hypothetical protein